MRLLVVAAVVVAASAVSGIAGSQRRPTQEQIDEARERYADAMVELQYSEALMDSPPQDREPDAPAWTPDHLEKMDPRARPFWARTTPVRGWRNLYNLGQVFLQLDDPASAIAALERYLERGGDDVPPARRADVERSLAALRPKVGSIEISVSPTDAEVIVAGARLPEVPLGATPAMPGSFTIEARRAGFAPASMSVMVNAGSAVRVPIVLERSIAVRGGAAPGSGRVDAARVPPRGGCACGVPANPLHERPGVLGTGVALLALLASRRRGTRRGPRPCATGAARRRAAPPEISPRSARKSRRRHGEFCKISVPRS